MADKDLKQMYRTRTEGNFPDTMEVIGRKYVKVENLRYGTNPHQPAAFYRPADAQGQGLVLGAYEILKTGKSGLSQTNVEDMHHAVGILKFMQRPACAVMKHCNPSGVAIEVDGMPLKEVYQRARDAGRKRAGRAALELCQAQPFVVGDRRKHRCGGHRLRHVLRLPVIPAHARHDPDLGQAEVCGEAADPFRRGHALAARDDYDEQTVNRRDCPPAEVLDPGRHVQKERVPMLQKKMRNEVLQ